MLKYNNKLTTYLFVFVQDIKRLKHHITLSSKHQDHHHQYIKRRFISLGTSIKDEDQPLLIIKPTSI
jgi:hypothetical protein